MTNRDKFRILLVHNQYCIPGGEDTVVVNEKKLLENNGHQVILYSRNNSELKNLNLLQKICLPFSMIFSFRTYSEIRKIIRENKIDLVHVHNTLILISPSVYYAAFSSHVPVVQTLHNFRLLCPGATFYRNGRICEECIKNGLMCAVRHRCYRNSLIQTVGCVLMMKIHRMIGTYRRLNNICLTDFNKEKLLQYCDHGRTIFEESKMFVKPNFTFPPAKQQGKRADSYYLYVGRIEHDKGVSILLKAFLKWKGEKLFLAGSGSLSDKLEEQKGFYRANHIFFLGQQDWKTITKLMWNAKALILPTQLYEGFPMVIAESFALGTPVICSDIGNAGRLVEDGVTGVKYTGTECESMISSIERFESLDRDAMRENARTVYQQNYSPEINYSRLIEIYHAVYNASLG